MKTWQSYATWLISAAIAEAIAIGFSAGPPLTGVPLILSHLTFIGIVLSGLVALFTCGEMLVSEPLFWAGVISGFIAMSLLVFNRNRRPILNVLAGALWCSSGGVGLFIGIVFAI